MGIGPRLPPAHELSVQTRIVSAGRKTASCQHQSRLDVLSHQLMEACKAEVLAMGLERPSAG